MGGWSAMYIRNLCGPERENRAIAETNVPSFRSHPQPSCHPKNGSHEKLSMWKRFSPTYRNFKHPFSLTGAISPERRVVSRSSQSHKCLVKIALLRGSLRPLHRPRGLMLTQFDCLRECRPSRIVGPIAEPVLA
jgi:hypothetical protein